mmetsp:Transcript_4698/g.10427  ORF Transcript_4698/g.10427 Transcript_4698/m.10427 type:complete len:121 (+) Transcript_4698:437-799(+)
MPRLPKHSAHPANSVCNSLADEEFDGMLAVAAGARISEKQTGGNSRTYLIITVQKMLRLIATCRDVTPFPRQGGTFWAAKDRASHQAPIREVSDNAFFGCCGFPTLGLSSASILSCVINS